MNAKKLDPRGHAGKRRSGTIGRFQAMTGLLPPGLTGVVDRHDPRQRPGRVDGPRHKSKTGGISRVLAAEHTAEGGRATASPRAVMVWDARAGVFRRVDPDNRHDPLHEPARQLDLLRASLSRNDRERPAARTTDSDPFPAVAVDRQRNDPPRSSTGGGTRVALDGAA